MDTPTQALKAGFLAAALVMVLLLSCSSPKQGPRPAAVYESVPQDFAYVDIGPDGGMPLEGGPIPDRPEAWMKKPPCNDDADEYAIKGACWQGTSRKPPCRALYEYRGMCYRPISKAPPNPISGPE